jgi:hypothetical protein
MTFADYDLPKIDTNYETAALRAANLIPAPWVAKGLAFYTPGLLPHHDPADLHLVRHLDPKAKGQTNDKGELFFDYRKDFTTQKPGKFLTTFFADKLTTPRIADLAADFRTQGTPPKLNFARTADEIEDIYNRGPSSCMKKSKAEFHGAINSVRSYAGPDLAVAYLDKAGGKTVSARAICWPAKKIYGRMYGDSIALQFALTAAGYTDVYSGKVAREIEAAFTGARLTPLYMRDRVVRYRNTTGPVFYTPYGDGFAYAQYDADNHHLVVGREQNNKFNHILRGTISTGESQIDPTAFKALNIPEGAVCV